MEEKNYMEFLSLCVKKIEEMTQENLKAEIYTTTRNNGVRMSGILLKKEEEPAAPNFYLYEQFKKWYQGKEGIDEIAENILCAYEQEKEKTKRIPQMLQFEWTAFKENVFARLIGREKNAELLRELPYEEYLDMAVVYYYVVQVSEEASGAMLIRLEHLEMFGITKEELHETAMDNTRRKLPAVLQGMDDVIRKLEKQYEVSVERNGKNYLYVLSNSKGMYGAVSLMFEEKLEQFAQTKECNFFILPSSVHEVLLLPDDGIMTAEICAGMVREVNATQVAATEVLTDSVYYYDRRVHAVRRVA